MDAGHCVTQQCRLIKFSELNSHAQCEECNRTYGGRFKEYIAKIRELYGNDLAETFLRYKKACPVKIFTRSELIELIYKYKVLSEERLLRRSLPSLSNAVLPCQQKRI